MHNWNRTQLQQKFSLVELQLYVLNPKYFFDAFPCSALEHADTN